MYIMYVIGDSIVGSTFMGYDVTVEQYSMAIVKDVEVDDNIHE